MIAVDALGGDFAPDIVLQGALQCAKTKQIPIVLFGPKDDIKHRLDLLDTSWPDFCLKIVDAPECIGMGEEPIAAFREKPNASLVKAVASVKSGECRAVVSAGNSGAMMAASLFLIGRSKGIERPALVGLLPGVQGAVICLDMGANADCKPEYLYQFAHLGVQYAKNMFSRLNPTVALLSNGEERSKGSLLTKSAFALLEKSNLNFIGNIEPGDIACNKADVVVSDGFSGNVLVKAVEATALLCSKLIMQEKGLSEEAKKTVFAMFHKKLNPADAQGGALLLGVKKPVVIVHGSASAHMISQAIIFAHKVDQGMDVSQYAC